MSDLKWQDAVSYSHNFATAKPDILPMEKEHILGLSKVLERVGSQRDELCQRLKELHEGMLFDSEYMTSQHCADIKNLLSECRGEPCDTAG
ncbi:hypothetical protein [Vreelandella titanicae]|uniref:hypothetical protein n=1 Tax=Vreelandella titanicae TaxID=664683 RepID=UPI00380DA5FC